MPRAWRNKETWFIIKNKNRTQPTRQICVTYGFVLSASGFWLARGADSLVRKTPNRISVFIKNVKKFYDRESTETKDGIIEETWASGTAAIVCCF